MFLKCLWVTGIITVTAGNPSTGPRRLPPVDGRVLTGAQAAARKGGDAGTRSFVEAYPEASSVFVAYKDRLHQFTAQYASDRALSPEEGRALVNELYEDTGNALLNWRWQDQVLTRISRAALRPDVGPEALAILRTGLFEYRDAGGGENGGPLLVSRLGESLASTTEKEHPECDEASEKLFRRATEWSRELANAEYEATVAADLRRVDRNYEKLEQIGRSATIADAGLRSWAATEQALHALEDESRATEAVVNRAAQRVAANRGDVHRGADTLCRLMTAYERILKRQPPATKGVVRAIDARLLWLAKDSRPLTSAPRWSCWSRAVAALGHRGSHELGRFVHDRQKHEADAEIAAALQRAESGLSRRP